MQHGQLERFLYKWVSASQIFPVYVLLPHHRVNSQQISFHDFFLFLHPQGLKCSRTLPWCCTSWWRSLTGPIPQRLYWRTQVPLGGSAEPASQLATHREVLTHSGPFSQDSPHSLGCLSCPLSKNPSQAMSLTGFAGFTKAFKVFQLLICNLAAWPVIRHKRKRNPGGKFLTLLNRASRVSAQSWY